MSNTAVKSFEELRDSFEVDQPYVTVKKGDIWWLELSDLVLGTGSVMIKNRTGLVISNDIGNAAATTVEVALMTSAPKKKTYPFHYTVNNQGVECHILFEQIITIDKFRLKEKCGELTPEQMKCAEESLMCQLGLTRYSLINLQGIDVVSRSNILTKTENYYTFHININYEKGRVVPLTLRLEKLQLFDKDINENTTFDELVKKLDCSKGLSFLTTNGTVTT